MHNIPARYQHMFALRNLTPDKYEETGELNCLPSTESVKPLFTSLQDSLRKELTNLSKNIKNSSKEKQSYLPIALLLNKLSRHAASNRKNDNPVVFLLNPSNLLPGDFLDTKVQPDMVARICTTKQLDKYISDLSEARKERYKRLPQLGDFRPAWGQSLAPLEIKKRESGEEQIANYLDVNKIYRVDLSYVIGLAGLKSGFNLFALSPCVMQRSDERYPWDDFLMLLRYIVGLYNCHEAKDPNMEFLPIASQAWICRVDDQKYLAFPFMATRGLGRNTWVAAGVSLNDDTSVVIKVSWVDIRVRHDEGEMYDLIGDIPGLMQLRKFWPPPDVENVKGGNIERRKCYLVTNSIGLPLSKCRSLSEFLTVMLEVCDVLKAMHERGVYHRDVSWHNVMLNKRNTSPSSAPWADGSGHSESESSTQNDDRNGNQGAFDPEHRTHTETVLQPKALVGDLDQSIRTGSTWKGRRNRTGTPMFISREFCGGSDLRYSAFVTLWPVVKNYLNSNQDPALSRIERLEKSERKLYRTGPADGDDGQNLEYNRRHDFESVFWIIVWFLARAWPREEPHEANGDDAYHKFVSDMLTHRIRSPQCDEPDETRGIWLGATPRRWRNVLHSSIKPLGPAVSLIGYYLSIDWRIWEDETDKNHAYAVIRAVLKNELDRIRTQGVDVKLNTRRRPAGPPLGSPTLERKTTTSASLIASVTSGDSTGNHDPKRDEEPPTNTLDQQLHRATETEPKEELRSGDVEYDTDIDESPEPVEELGSLTRQASKLSQDTVPKLITQDILDKFTSGGDNGPLDRWAKMSYEMRVAWIEDRDWFTWGNIKEEDEADE